MKIFNVIIHLAKNYAEKAFTMPPRVFIKKSMKTLIHLYEIKKKAKTLSTYQTGLSFRGQKLVKGLFNANKFSFDDRKVIPLRLVKPKINPGNKNESDRLLATISGPYQLIDWQAGLPENTLSQYIKYSELSVDKLNDRWKLARLEHLHPDNKRDFQNQVLDFIATNPPEFGLNWMSTKEVSLRVINWLAAFERLSSSGIILDEVFESAFIRSIYEHGHYIYHHLEWDPYQRSSDYIANIAGLIFASSYLPASSETNSWYKFGVQELIREAINQFNPEKRPNMALKIVSDTTSLIQKKDPDFQFPKEYSAIVKKMREQASCAE